MFYLVKTPWVVKKLMFPEYVWSFGRKEKKIYLTFDDGPHPEATVFVLDELKKYDAKATFFCIGKNVVAHPEIYARILQEGHATGNHTNNHLNGWKETDADYLKNIREAAKSIQTSLFRPPYGRITRFQAKQVMEKFQYDIIMWSVLSGDFDIHLSPEDCWKKVQGSTGAGDIVVFHDSEKAMKRLRYVLPRLLEQFSSEGFGFEKIIL
jgi:peptidoglycan/xylan/chitin deacetylase (PgdA/CDA1 family)